eukprot:Nk52_evm72s207 gene=Nk52_evmTU72s207
MKMSHFQITSFLEKAANPDKDYRFMATNDLMNEIQKPSFSFEHDYESKVVTKLLKLLEDPNGEVQNLAMKCLGPLSKKIKDEAILEMVTHLCSNMLNKDESLRDISISGMKLVFAELSQASPVANAVCDRLAEQIIPALSSNASEAIVLEALDILGDALERFGSLFVHRFSVIQEILLSHLSHSRLAVRKRAAIALGHLCSHANENSLNNVFSFLCSKLEQQLPPSICRAYIHCISILTKYAGSFIGKHLGVLFPLILRCSNVDDDEVREMCIQTLEAFTLRCAKEVKPFLENITSVCLQYIKYDPNYNYDDENGDGDDYSEMDTDGEDEDDDDSDAYSDDDDMSWKVRRASGKCIAAIVNTNPELLCSMYKTVSPVLLSRFKEREENVQIEIFNAYIALLKQTKFIAQQSIGKGDDTYGTQNELLSLLYAEVPVIVRCVKKQLKQKSIKIKLSCFSILTELVYSLPGALAAHVSELIPGIELSLSDRLSTSNLKIETLVFVSALFTSHEPTVFNKDSIASFVKITVNAIKDPFYKISSEGLHVCTLLAKVIRPQDIVQSFDFNPFVKPLYEAAFPLLQAIDIDHEVKERCIVAMATIIAIFADILRKEQLDLCLPIYLERLKNEITRLIAVKGIILITKSIFDISIPMLNEIVVELANLLKKNSRPLKLAALASLSAIVEKYGNSESFDASNYRLLARELVSMVNDGDLHITQLALGLLSKVICKSPASIPDIVDGSGSDILGDLRKLIRSSLLQGGALEALTEVLKNLLLVSFERNINVPSLQYNNLIVSLLDPVYGSSPSSSSQTLALSKQGFYSTAHAVAALTLSCPGEGVELIKKLLADITSDKTTESVHLLCLLILGNIGSALDLSSYTNIQEVLMGSFKSNSEDVKSAASFAFGNICVGNLEYYVPKLVEQIKNHGKEQYLLLHALKETISTEAMSREGMSNLHQYIKEIWGLLFDHCESREEGTRNVVAECLGKLTVMNPELLLPELRKRLTSPSEFTRGIVAAAVKFTIVEKPSPIDNMLKACFGEFMNLIKDENVNVRRLALVAFNNAAHSKPGLIRSLLPDILSSIYGETVVRKELIRKVQMGPFTHIVDDGLEIRKVAYECMYTLLETSLDRLDIFEFLNYVQQGLADEDDVKMLNQVMLVRLCIVAPHALLQRIENLIPPLQATILKETKPNAVKQEVEKNEEIIKSALRAINCMMKMPEGDTHVTFVKFCNCIRNHATLKILLESIQKDENQKLITDSMDLS